MNDVSLSDVLIHIDESLTPERRGDIEARLRSVDGVVSVRNPDDRPHLTIVEYRGDKTDAGALLAGVRAHGVHAELIGL